MAKSKQKKVLGRGLSALLNDTDNEIESIEDKNTDNINNAYNNINNVHEPFRQDHKDALPRDT